MKSLPAAMTWELLARERWGLAAAALVALAFPVMIFTTLKAQGGVNPEDPSMLTMHFLMVQVNIATFGWGLVVAGLRISPLFPLPLTASTLVTWRLLPVMALMAVETIVWTATLNGIFELGWTYAGPAFLSAVAMAAVFAALWLTTGSRWSVFGVTVVAVVLGFWFKSRYGAPIGELRHYWWSLTLAEGLTLAVFATVSYALAVVGVKRSRRGERPFTLGLIDWLDRVLELKRSPLRASATPAQSQLWYAWRYGWFMPTTVALGILFGMVIWFFTSRDVRALVSEFPATSFLLAGIAMLGVLAFGNLGGADSLIMGPFLSTRPIGTADIARVTLRAAATSLLWTWVVWLAALALICAAALMNGSVASHPWSNSELGRTIGFSMLLSWLVLGTFLSLALCGRTRFLFRLFSFLSLSYLAVVLISKYTLPPHAHAQVMLLLVILIAVGCILATVWVYAAASRRGLISSATVWMALAMAAVLAVGEALMFSSVSAWPPVVFAIVAASSAAAVAPLAAAPLALSYNRVR
jgi:hypothetical protein